MFVSLCRRSWRLFEHVSVVVDVSGVRIPLREGLGLNLIDKPTPHMPVLKRLGSRSGAVVDIGANIGAMLVSMLRVGQGDRRYIAFEPQVQAAAYIERLIAANHLEQSASVVGVGLSDQAGAATIWHNHRADVAATIMTQLRPASFYKRRSIIPLATGDEQLANVNEIALIKLDVEGAEHLVLRGLRHTIARCRPAIAFEVLPFQSLLDGTYPRSFLGELTLEQRKQMAEFRQTHARKLEQQLGEYGYSFGRVRQDGIEAVPSLDRAGQADGDNDYVAMPSMLDYPEGSANVGKPGP